MKLFAGKTEEQLKEWQKQLENLESTLKENEVDQKRQKSALLGQEKSLSRMIAEQTKKEAELVQLENDLQKKEIEAKNGFAEQQRESFKEVIEIRWDELKKESKILEEKQRIVNEKLSELFKKEATITKRERATLEDKLKAENGFADLNKIALRELEKRESTSIALEEQLKFREETLRKEIQEYEEKKEAMRKREDELGHAEIVRDEGFADERKKLSEDLSIHRKEFEKEISEQRLKYHDELSKVIEEERKARLKNLEKELSNVRKNLEKSESDWSEKYAKEKKELRTRKADVESKIDVFTGRERMLESRKDRLDEREKEIEAAVERQIKEHKKAYEKENQTLRNDIEVVINSRTSLKQILNTYEQLRNDLGDEPEKVKLKLSDQVEILKNLRNDLANRPNSEMQIEYDRLKKEIGNLKNACERLSEENVNLKERKKPKAALESRINELETENASLQTMKSVIEKDNIRMKEIFDRNFTAYKSNKNSSDRIESIEAPYIKKAVLRAKNEVNEIDWLNHISESCVEYGFKFPRRILHAFHTSLKTSEWSPITILAGVSGTGKSELPRLYSHFGGLNFMNLSVQPNWDSKESMLGFFNSIDNKFDAQPVLRLLVQSQKKKSAKYPLGLDDTMTLILMDEMNLAHIEMYFAEFLSKFEQRRGLTDDKIPNLELDIGAGEEFYNLPLGRNVLWTGTMNQDETTKSLSDKVLDRGIIITFPRPIHLERRKEMKSLSDQPHLLKRDTWDKWRSEESKFTADEISPYIGFVEEINESLAKVGRALGHRVWQSIEHYMSNYPAVILAQESKKKALLKKAMKIAFEDQLVQKVMPKLRGIETTGTSKSECLDKIRGQLDKDDYAIVDDFDISCNFEYGQFAWKSANYITEENGNNVLEVVLNQFASAAKKNYVKPSKGKPKQSTSVAKEKSVDPSKKNPSKNISGSVQDAIKKGIIPKELIRYSEAFNLELDNIPIFEIKRLTGCTVTQLKEIRKIIREKTK